MSAMPLFRAHCEATGYVDPPAFAHLPHVEWEGGGGGPRLTRYDFLVKALTGLNKRGVTGSRSLPDAI